MFGIYNLLQSFVILLVYILCKHHSSCCLLLVLRCVHVLVHVQLLRSNMFLSYKYILYMVDYCISFPFQNNQRGGAPIALDSNEMRTTRNNQVSIRSS